mmetsp:Transcript_6959/g.12902  ORF Transcript_6959/g.12902 Transcript_6959/m.12902 type:complete len:219 (-) Transcript_6959:1296-1952(-)
MKKSSKEERKDLKVKKELAKKTKKATKTSLEDGMKQILPSNEERNDSVAKEPAKKTKKAIKISFDGRLKQCKAFREKFGHCKMPTHNKEDKSLGIWVQEIRRNYKLTKQGKKARCKLTDEQIEELDKVEFHWGYTPDPNSPESDASWNINFAKLQEYQKAHGDFNIPMTDQFSNLSKWAKAQRKQKNFRETKRKTFITKERVAKLEEIGFDWNGDRDI